MKANSIVQILTTNTYKLIMDIKHCINIKHHKYYSKGKDCERLTSFLSQNKNKRE